MSVAQKLFDLYKPSDLAVGKAQELLDDNPEAGFKVKRRYWTERRQATVDDFQIHLNKVVGVGIPPINSKAECTWGAIDVDNFTGDLEDIVPGICAKFPFLNVVRSKSGSFHVYLFLDNYYPAADLVSELGRMAGILGLSKSEIFPKQSKVRTENGPPDCGSWLNVAYYGGNTAYNCGLTRLGKVINDPLDWVDLMESSRVSLATVAACQPLAESNLFHDGPPCLEQVWSQGVPDNRNTSIVNAMVYLKKKFPEGDLLAMTLELNSQIANPLPENEVKRSLQSYANKDYRYQCSQQPLCRFCNADLCKKRDFGIDGTTSFLAGNRSLSKVLTNPPVWFLDLRKEEGGDWFRISLTTEQLQNPRLFQRRVMETLNSMPVIPKPQVWHEDVNKLLETVTEITIDAADTPIGRLHEHLYEYLSERGGSTDPTNLLRGNPCSDQEYYYFRSANFETFLENQRFKSLPQTEILAAIRTEFGATTVRRRIEGSLCRCWRLPKTFEAPVPGIYNEETHHEDII